MAWKLKLVRACTADLSEHTSERVKVMRDAYDYTIRAGLAVRATQDMLCMFVHVLQHLMRTCTDVQLASYIYMHMACTRNYIRIVFFIQLVSIHR